MALANPLSCLLYSFIWTSIFSRCSKYRSTLCRIKLHSLHLNHNVVISQDEGSAILLHRDQLRELRAQIVEAEAIGDEVAAMEARAQFKEIETKILNAFKESSERRYIFQSF